VSANQATSAFLSPEEENALLPLKAKWEKELASLQHQLTILTNRKSELTRMLASLNGILPPKDDGQSATAEVPGAPLPQSRGPAPGTASGVNPIPEQRNAGRGKKKFAPVYAYWLPTLQALTELGGKARRDDVVELVGKKMQGVLTPDDQELLPSGIEVRWKNRVAWQRENMKRQGLLRDDSPQGIWEITEAGRKWLLDVSGRLFFYTLAALRIGNLSGDRAHPVTMGGYRNFVRQYAQEFGEPALGEADDHVLLDPMVLLWKDGRMELKKYEPARNLWWDFSELGDVRLLVGAGDWTIRLTPEGRAMLATLQEQAKLMNERRADMERPKKMLEDAPRSHEFLSDYVRELELQRNEEDIFIRLAFQNVSAGGAHGRGDTFVTSTYSELYDQPLDASQKQEVRRWWHDKVQREAERHDDLQARLAKFTWLKGRS
jgi:hypothetical protein